MNVTAISDSLRADRAVLARMLDRTTGCLVSHGYVVVTRSNGTQIALDFDVDNKVATNVRSSHLSRCSRFVEQDARTLAASVQDGAGNRGVAVSERDALQFQIAALDTLISALGA